MFDTFNKHAVSSIKTRVFEKEIFNNEIIWTYIIAKLALKNDDIYKKITTFNKHELHSIYLESQPIVPYIGDEGNSYLDMALGSLGIRTETQSGIEFNQGHGKDVCFLEAKYLSDISVKTTHNPVRNQMDRVIENLLCFQGKDSEQNVIYPDNIVFTLLTPKIFKETVGTRLYYYKFHEYKKINSNNNLDLMKMVGSGLKIGHILKTLMRELIC
jgi:hypothetical protein